MSVAVSPKKIIQILILIAGIGYCWNALPHSMVWADLKAKFHDPTANLDIRPGDIIFQDIHGKLFRVIEDVSGSRLTHCGIVVRHDGDLYVLEAIGPVMLTPLKAWVHRGIGSRFAVVRLKAPYRSHVPAIIRAGYAYLSKPYDFQYEMTDDKIYCSELVYKAVETATGIRLGPLRRLGDLKWQGHEAFIRAMTGGELPLDRKIITPGDLAASDKADVVFSNFIHTPSRKKILR
ncbi:MAG: hypothetical protein KC900_14315 [Candidatus Omnitrophica bacterium]|nr:hypothetical protein [Candidatus Omnitrophota bacterium]